MTKPKTVKPKRKCKHEWKVMTLTLDKDGNSPSKSRICKKCGYIKIQVTKPKRQWQRYALIWQNGDLTKVAYCAQEAWGNLGDSAAARKSLKAIGVKVKKVLVTEL